MFEYNNAMQTGQGVDADPDRSYFVGPVTSDTTAPQIDSFSLSSNNINTNYTLQSSVDVLTNVTDDLSGIRSGLIVYRSPSTSQTVVDSFSVSDNETFTFSYFKSRVQ